MLHFIELMLHFIANKL